MLLQKQLTIKGDGVVMDTNACGSQQDDQGGGPAPPSA